MKCFEKRIFFNLVISPELREGMRRAKMAYGTNWGFVIRSAIIEHLGTIEK